MARTIQTSRHYHGRRLQAAPPPWRSSLRRIRDEVQRLKCKKRGGIFKKIKTQHRGSESFNFLGLPRELRDEIYSYLVGKHSSSNKWTYDAIQTQAQFNLHPRRSPRNADFTLSATGVLGANIQLHNEAMDTIFRECVFLITLDPVSPVFSVREMKTGTQFKEAVPFGWDLSRITQLYLRVDLGPEYKVEENMKSFNFDSLKCMCSLSTLKLIVTSWRNFRFRHVPLNGNFAVNLKDWIDDNGHEKSRMTGFRDMMRRLVGALPERAVNVEFAMMGAGRETGGSQQEFQDIVAEEPYACYVPGDIVESTFKKLRNDGSRTDEKV